MQAGVFCFPVDHGVDPGEPGALDVYRARGINSALVGIPDLTRNEILRLLAPLPRVG
jgi:hypothetical protein